MTEFASPEPVTSDGLQPTVAAVAKALADRADELGDALEEAVTRKSNVAVVLSRDDVSDAVCRANIRSILAAMVDETQFDSAPATTIGVQRARNVTAFSSLLASDRIGFRRLWDIVANEAARHTSINAEALRSLTARLHTAEDLYMHAMVTGYRDERRRRVLGETPGRAVLIGSLLHGRTLDDWSLWDVANRLRLPCHGPYLVVHRRFTLTEGLSAGTHGISMCDTGIRGGFRGSLAVPVSVQSAGRCSTSSLSRCSATVA